MFTHLKMQINAFIECKNAVGEKHVMPCRTDLYAAFVFVSGMGDDEQAEKLAAEGGKATKNQIFQGKN